jgi:peptidoglycan/LPS O-acetylase OafA/YrhL
VSGISHGVYLFHPLINHVVLIALAGSPPSHHTGKLKGFFLAILVSACTLGFATLSFYGMENRLVGN